MTTFVLGKYFLYSETTNKQSFMVSRQKNNHRMFASSSNLQIDTIQKRKTLSRVDIVTDKIQISINTYNKPFLNIFFTVCTFDLLCCPLLCFCSLFLWSAERKSWTLTSIPYTILIFWEKLFLILFRSALSSVFIFFACLLSRFEV